jgi:hypothetical protein
MMKVAQTYESHSDLWHALPPDVRSVKVAHLKGNAQGDLYKPKHRLKDEERFDPHNYTPGWSIGIVPSETQEQKSSRANSFRLEPIKSIRYQHPSA